ncbi:MAG: hypothetical protein AAF465_02360 [Pseudomonadota bacterium]
MKTTKIFVLWMASMAITVGAMANDKADTLAIRSCDHADMVDFWEGSITGSETSGGAILCQRGETLFAAASVNGLTPDHAYTVWWVYIDDPAACANFPLPAPDVIPFPEPADYAGSCGLADFFTMDPSGEFANPLVVFGRMDSAIAQSQERVRFSGTLRDFTPREGSQVWLFAFGHGPADTSDKRQLARQLLTPEDPLSGAPHLGIEGREFGYPSTVAVFMIE